MLHDVTLMKAAKAVHIACLPCFTLPNSWYMRCRSVLRLSSTKVSNPKAMGKGGGREGRGGEYSERRRKGRMEGNGVSKGGREEGRKMENSTRREHHWRKSVYVIRMPRLTHFKTAPNNSPSTFHLY